MAFSTPQSATWPSSWAKSHSWLSPNAHVTRTESTTSQSSAAPAGASGILLPPPSTKDSYRPTVFGYTGETESFQHISTMEEFRRYSAEELRLAEEDQTSSGDHKVLAVALFRGGKLPHGPPFSGTSLHFIENYGSRVILFKVGTDPIQDFRIHETIVTARSSFVRSALTNGWKESSNLTIALPDDSPHLFEIYQIWLYQSRIHVKSDMEMYRNLVGAYILGDKLLDSDFKTAVLKSVIRRFRNSSRFDVRLVGLIYDGTPENSPLRELLLDIYLWTADSSWLDESRLDEPLPRDFLLELNKRQLKVRQSSSLECPLPAFFGDENSWQVYYGSGGFLQQ